MHVSQHFLPHPSVKQSAIVALLVGLKVSLGSHVPKQRLVSRGRRVAVRPLERFSLNPVKS